MCLKSEWALKENMFVRKVVQPRKRAKMKKMKRVDETTSTHGR